MSHTPGDWNRIYINGGWTIDANGGKTDIARIVPRSDESESEANAKIVAAAPKLLAALQQLLAVKRYQRQEGRTPSGKICYCARH